MTKQNISVIAGSVILAISGIFALKPEKNKFGVPTALYYTNAAGGTCTILQSYGIFGGHLTTGGFGAQMAVFTANGFGIVYVYSTSHCSAGRAVHFHP